MKIQVLIILIEVVLIILALAVYLIATIIQLFKINAGLDVVLPAVGEIGAKTAPINGVLGGIVKNLVMARDALEGLHSRRPVPTPRGSWSRCSPARARTSCAVWAGPARW